MKSAGRKPKPPELKVLQGNPGKRAIPEAAPTYPPLTEHPPDELTPKGKALWRRVMNHLGPGGIVQATDREALLVLCDLWSTYCDAMDLVRKHGTLIKSKNNNQDRASVIVNPAWRVARDASKAMESLWASFGLTPSDRGRIDAKPAGGANATKEFLFGKRGATG